MPSIVLVSPDGAEVTVTNTLDFNALVYGQGYRPETGTIADNFSVLLGSGTPAPDLNKIVRVSDLTNPESDAGAALRAASVAATLAAIQAGDIPVPTSPTDIGAQPAGDYVTAEQLAGVASYDGGMVA